MRTPTALVCFLLVHDGVQAGLFRKQKATPFLSGIRKKSFLSWCGGADPNHPFAAHPNNNALQQQQQQQQQQQRQQQLQGVVYPTTTTTTTSNDGLSSANVPSTADKLLSRVGKGYRMAIFFVLMWRDVHLCEVADQVFKNRGLSRLVIVTPLCMLFVANLAGVVSTMNNPNSRKTRLKTILNLNKLVEILLVLFSFGRLTLFPNDRVPREIYTSNIIHSVFFLMQCQTTTSMNWQDDAPSSPQMMNHHDPYYYDANNDGQHYNAYQQQQQDGFAYPYQEDDAPPRGPYNNHYY